MHACLHDSASPAHLPACSPLLSEGDFEAKPSVLLLGQYSTGKSTFIKYLLGRDYPGIHIGPEPTTDRWDQPGE